MLVTSAIFLSPKTLQKQKTKNNNNNKKVEKAELEKTSSR